MKEGKSVKLNGPQQHQNGHLSPFKFAKLLDPEASWDKDQLGDVLHWIRQAVALRRTRKQRGIRVAICLVKFMDALYLIDMIQWLEGNSFLALSSGIIYGYYAMILKVDEEDFGGHGALLQEGLFASITLFLDYKVLPRKLILVSREEFQTLC
ncbi:hypothetical protein L484_025258 [Morus notabilis]|uniref:Uncharacterized protein n=1 Tax=Morus notabilis TaxID=981085 RepID=W9SIS1_9ROSA|nr:hypothetical protein L484_025258 [Morus notabilis]